MCIAWFAIKTLENETYKVCANISALNNNLLLSSQYLRYQYTINKINLHPSLSRVNCGLNQKTVI